MPVYVLSFKPAIGPFGVHDPSAAIFEDGRLVFGVEEERYTREKHAASTFPENAIRACLDHVGIELPDVNEVVLPYDPRLQRKVALTALRRELTTERSLARTLQGVERQIENQVGARFFPTANVEPKLREIGTPLPPIELRSHHACHAASAFHPTEFEEALVVTLDGKGEYDATVVWSGTADGLERVRTYEVPNSLGHFFAVLTEYLGYRSFNGEGKVMGLAPYGDRNEAIASTLREHVRVGADYDVTAITGDGIEAGVGALEQWFDRPRNRTPGEFDDWQQSLAFEGQRMLEEIVTDLVEGYCSELETSHVGLAGGVALNCKLNKRIMELDAVDELFIQPVAHDGGLAIGGGYVDQEPAAVEPMSTVYYGPAYDRTAIVDLLETNKISYTEPADVEATVARKIADGELIGWFQGRLEMGPRALGNRSILADPRTAESRDRVNRFVKHREEWRPFAPSMLEEAVEEYLVDGESSPYMIKTFDVRPDRREEMTAVLHPADDTTRPQTVTAEENPRYYRLISEFEAITGVPVVLNTSFNDHAEPIVNDPKEAIKDFYGMGLDTLVLGDLLVEKAAGERPARIESDAVRGD